MPVTRFADLPVVDVTWGDETKNQNDILGDPPDWERYGKAFLWHDPTKADTKEGYKLMVAKVVDGQLKVVWRQLVSRMATINGAREGINLPVADKRGAFNHALRYWKKFKGPDTEETPPEFKGDASSAEATRLTLTQIQLNIPADSDPAKPVWVQVAAEGKFDGYKGGEVSFTFDERVFQQIVRNFRRHPSYQAGSEGYGSADVIAWDFHHASESDPTEGSIPYAGAPAQGWVQDLEVRFDEAGKAQLWALTRWLEPARTYIQTERYRWASVSVVFDAVDPKSGENIGAVLTSVALTNSPFIEGMTPLAATKRAIAKAQRAAVVSLRRYFDVYLEPTAGPEDALNAIRDMLQLPETADAVTVVGELEKLRQWSTTGTAPLGVDVDMMLAGLRRILNLPALASPDEVFAEVDKLTARLSGESGVSQTVTPPQAGPGAPPEPPAPPAPAPMERKNMDLLKVIAESLGVVADVETVKGAVTELVTLRNAAAKAVGLEQTAATKVVLKQTIDNESVRTKYRAILGALGVEDPDAAMDRIAELITQSEDLKKAAPELAALRQAKAEAEEQEIIDDVDELAASRNWSDDVKPALLEYRRSNPEGFAAKYPKQPKPPAAAAHLTSKIVPADKSGSGKIDLSRYEGRNRTEKAIAWIKANDKDAAQLNWEQLNERAWLLLRSGQVAA